MTSPSEKTPESDRETTADQLQAALKEAADASVALLADLDELVTAAREAVEAWQTGQCSDLAMARLARCVARHQVKG